MLNEQKGKIGYLEGIRGIAAFLVFLHHFFLAFYPSYYDGSPATAHLGGIELGYYASPLSFLTNGRFCVAVFFVLSGYVLSRKYYNQNNLQVIVSSAQRRYFRLFIPIGFTVIVSYILLQLSLYDHLAAAKITQSWWLPQLWNVDPSFPTFLKNFFYGVLFDGDNRYDTSLWTMSTEFFGSFLVFALLALTHNVKRRNFAFICVLVMLYATEHFYWAFPKNYFYCAFIFGMLLNYLETIAGKTAASSAKNIMVALAFAFGLLLGSFPSTGFVTGTCWKFIDDPDIIKSYDVFHVIGAMLVVSAVVFSQRLQGFFSRGIFIFLGFISFSLYLIHPLIIGAFSCPLFVKLYTPSAYNSNVFEVWLLSTILLILVSYFMAKKVDQFGISFSKRFDEWMGRAKTPPAQAK